MMLSKVRDNIEAAARGMLAINGYSGYTIYVIIRKPKKITHEFRDVSIELTANKITSLVCEYYSSDIKLVLHSRRKPFVFWRQIIYYILRKRYGFGFRIIGEVFGYSNCTVQYGSKIVSEQIEVDKYVSEDISKLLDFIKENY